MALSGALAVEFGLLDHGELARILTVFASLRLPMDSDLCEVDACQWALGEVARHRGGDINLVVPVAIGTATFVVRPEDISNATLRAALYRLRKAKVQTPISAGVA
jgi:3-dehydroquinate synthetase